MTTIDRTLRLKVLAMAKEGLSYTHIRKLTSLNYRTIRRILNSEKEVAELGFTIDAPYRAPPKPPKPPRLPTPAEEVKMNYVRIADRVLSIAESIMCGRNRDENREAIRDGIERITDERSERTHETVGQTPGNPSTSK